MNARSMAVSAMIAAAYAALTIAFASISFLPLQARVSEMLTVLPFVTPLAVPGLFLGCIIANLLGGFGVHDVVFGSLATLLAAWLTRRMPAAWLAPLPPIVVNALIVPAYLQLFFGLPYWLMALQIAAGQTIACYGLGYPFLIFIRRNKPVLRLLQGKS